MFNVLGYVGVRHMPATVRINDIRKLLARICFVRFDEGSLTDFLLL